MVEVRVENVTKKFGKVEAIHDLSFKVKDKEMFCLLGYPGAGKTTTLKTIAGLEIPNQGHIYIDEEQVDHIYPGDRDIAMVFQNLALYSNKTIFENLASPLKVRKTPKDEIKRKVLEIARTLRIEHALNRYPATLSGGERQRVATGRALIRRPRLFLLDEPLSNLDALLRLEMRTELKKLQAELNQTIIFSTHDQLEALSIADRILLLHNGKMQQCDVPEEMYKRPINKYVANFIGSPTMNFIDCTLVTEGNEAYFDSGAFHINATEFKETMEKHASASEFILGVRPEHVYVGDRTQSKEAFQAKVELTEPLGNMTIIHFTIDNIHIKALIPSGNVPEIGRKIWVNFDPKKIYIYNRKTERNIISLSKEK